LETPHCTVFSNLLLFHPLPSRSKHSLQHLVLKHHQSSLKVVGQVSHPYKTGIIIVLLILFYVLERAKNNSDLNGNNYFPDLMCSLFFMNTVLLLFKNIQN